jgi:hypothetical protein
MPGRRCVVSSVVATCSGDIIRLPLLSHGFSEPGDVSEVWDAGPSLGKDGAGVGVDLGVADGSPTGTFQPKVKSSDSAEERGVRGIHQRPFVMVVVMRPPSARSCR